MKPLTDIQAKSRAEALCAKLRTILPMSFIPKPHFVDSYYGGDPAWGIRIAVDGCDYYPNGNKGCLSILDIKATRTLKVQEIMDELLKSMTQFAKGEGEFQVRKRVEQNMKKLLYA